MYHSSLNDTHPNIPFVYFCSKLHNLMAFCHTLQVLKKNCANNCKAPLTTSYWLASRVFKSSRVQIPVVVPIFETSFISFYLLIVWEYLLGRQWKYTTFCYHNWKKPSCRVKWVHVYLERNLFYWLTLFFTTY